MLKNVLSPTSDYITPTLVFGASHTQDSIWQGNPEKKQIIYLAGKMIVVRELVSQKVTLIKLSDNVEQVHFLGVSPDRKNAIVSETLSNDTSLSLGIYSLADGTKRLFRILTSNPENHFRLFDFAKSMPNLVVLLSQSNQVYMVDLDKLRHICYFNLEKQVATSMKVCVDDSHLVSICSRDFIKVFRIQQYGLKQLETVKGVSNYKFTCHMWNEGGLFVGTEQGSILWLSPQSGHYQLQSQLKLESGVLHISQAGTNKLISVSENGYVHLWEADYRNSKLGVDYEIIRTWKLAVGRAAAIKSLLVTQKLEQIVMGFEDNYIGVVDVIEMYSRGASIQDLEIDYLYKGSNSGGITSTDVCLQRPIIASVSKIDRSVRVYNYRLNRCDLVKYYTEKHDSHIECVSVHPSGYYLALGFIDKLKVVHLLHNDLKEYRQISFRQVEYVKFSNQGAYLAVGCAKSPQQISSWQLVILNSFTLETLHSFVDWGAPIVSIRFNHNDTLVVAMCNGGSLRLCGLGSDHSTNKIASRSTKLHTSMTVYEPTNLPKNKTLSIFSCSPHPKQGSTIRQCKQVAKKYVQRFYQVREYNITQVEVFYKTSTTNFRLLAGCGDGRIILYSIPFDAIPLLVINAHSSRVSTLLLSSCESLLFSSCKDGILLCSEIQPWSDVSGTPKGQCVEEGLSDVMLMTIIGLKETQDKNKKLITGINQVEQRSKQLQRDLRGKFEEKLTNTIKQKDIQIQMQKDKFKQYLQESKRIEAKHKQQLENLQSRNSQAVSDLEVLFERKIFLEAEQNLKLRHHINKQQQKYKDELQQLESIHTQNVNTLTLQFNQMLTKTATLYRKQTTKQKVSEKGYQQKLKVIDEEYEQEIQKLIEKHNAEEAKRMDTILKLNRQIDSLKGSIRGYSDSIIEKNRQITYLKEEIEDMKVAAENKEKNIKQLDTLLGEKQVFVTESNNKMNEMRDKFKDIEKKRVILNVKAAEWREAIQPREQEIERLRNKLFELQAELDTLINKEEIHINTIETLEAQKHRLSKLTKQQALSLKSYQNTVSNILMDIKNILDKPKESNRSYHEQIMVVFKKYNNDGERYLGGNTIEGLGEINRQVMHLQKTLDIKNKTSKKAMEQKALELNKKAVENNELIRDLNDFKIKYKQQALELKGKQKIIDDLTNDLKQYSIRKSSRTANRTLEKIIDKTGQKITKHETPLSMSRSNSLRVHKISKGSNFEPTLISNQKKQKLIEITSENELMRQYIIKLENKEANIREKIARHLKGCQSTDRILEEILA